MLSCTAYFILNMNKHDILLEKKKCRGGLCWLKIMCLMYSVCFLYCLIEDTENCACKGTLQKASFSSSVILQRPNHVTASACGWACESQTDVTKWSHSQLQIPAYLLEQLMYSVTRTFTFSITCFKSCNRIACYPQVTSVEAYGPLHLTIFLCPVVLVVVGDGRVAVSCVLLPKFTPSVQVQ